MMAQSHPWLTLAEASTVLGIPEFQVLDLAVSGRLHSRVKHDHREICNADVIEFDVEMHTARWDVLAAHGGDDQTASPTVGAGPELPAFIDDEYERLKDEP